MHPLDIAFWACLMLGGGYMAAIILMGGVSHAVGDVAGHVGDALGMNGGHVGHADVGHIDAGHADAGQADAGHADAGDLDVAHGDQGDAHGTDVQHDGGQAHHHAAPNLLLFVSPMSLASFCAGFGLLGVAARLAGAGLVGSTLWALAGGLGLWWAGYFVISRFFAASGGTSHNRQEELVGLRARVTVPIEGERPGMVCYTITGARQSVRAITDGSETIPVGATVRIKRIHANTAYVTRIE